MRHMAHNILYGGRWWLPSNPDCGEFCEFKFAYVSSMHQSALITY